MALCSSARIEFFSCGAYPLEDIHDPTGAGDTFAGGMAGYLAARKTDPTFADLRRAIIYGSVLASFNVEAFSLERLRTLTMDEIAERYRNVQGDELVRGSVRSSSGRRELRNAEQLGS